MSSWSFDHGALMTAGVLNARNTTYQFSHDLGVTKRRIHGQLLVASNPARCRYGLTSVVVRWEKFR